MRIIIHLYCPWFQAHSGVKGVVRDALSGEPIPNAVIQVKNITRVAKATRRNSDIDHDITSGELGFQKLINILNFGKLNTCNQQIVFAIWNIVFFEVQKTFRMKK